MPQTAESTSRRAEALFRRHQREIFVATDQLFAKLMICQWIASVLLALWVSPHAWSGLSSHVHLHVWLAIFLGGAITVFPVWTTKAWPGTVLSALRGCRRADAHVDACSST